MKIRLEYLTEFKASEEKASKYKLARWVSPEKGKVLAQLIEESGCISYFESGTANGYSSAFAATALPWNGIVHTFDPADRLKIWEEKEIRTWPRIGEIKYHKGGFEQEVAKYLPVDGKKFFFIDGDHSFNGVVKDYDAISKYLSEGDYIVFDDIASERRTLKAFLSILGSLPHFVTKFEVERKWIESTVILGEKTITRSSSLGIIRIKKCEDIEPGPKEVIG